MAMFRTEDYKTALCRVSFAHNLFEARKQGDGPTAREKFGATFIFPNAALTEKVQQPGGKMMSLQDLVAECIKGEWGDKGLKRAADGLIKSPFLKGDGKEARNKETGDLHPGMGSDVFFIRASANADRPPKVSSSAGAFVPASKEDVYSGCFGFAVLNCFAWHNDQNGDGVSFGIQMFFKKADGDRLGGGGSTDPDKWAEALPDTGAAPAATKSGAGAGGLFGSVME